MLARCTHRAPLAVALMLAVLAAVAAYLVATVVGVPTDLAVPLAVGAVTIPQAAVLSENDLQAGVLERFIIESPIFDRMPLKPIEGNAYAYNAEATLPGTEFRAVNAAYAESTGTVVQATETIAILGGDADVDTFIQATRSNLNDQLETQIRLKVKSAAFKYHDAVFNGDVAVDANSFDGLKKRLVGAQVLVPAVNGISVVGNGGTDIEVTLDQLDALLAAAKIEGDNGAVYVNDLIRARILSAARRAKLTDQELVEVGPVTKRVETYRGTPILNAGLKVDGTRILPQTETVGTSTDCSSAYAVRFGDDEADGGTTGLVNTNHEGANSIEEGLFAVKRLGEQQAKPAHRIRVEGFVGMATFSGQAAARLTGLRNS